MLQNRSASGAQVPDPTKFPDGMGAYVAKIHGMGLKAGLYTAQAAHTCGGRAASCGHEETDAQNYAKWDIDYVSRLSEQMLARISSRHIAVAVVTR